MEYVNEKLIEFNHYLQGRKVAVIGLGVSNLPLLDYLYELKAKVSVFDKTEIKDLNKTVLRKVTNYGMGMSFGENYLDELVGFDIIFRSPSCLPTTPQLVAEAERGAIITTEVEMVIELCPRKSDWHYRKRWKDNDKGNGGFCVVRAFLYFKNTGEF